MSRHTAKYSNSGGGGAASKSGGSFASALRDVAALVPGENGAMKVSMDEAGYVPALAMTDAVRKGGGALDDATRAVVITWMNKMLDYAERTGNPVAAADAIKLAFHKRNPHEGEGEKDIGIQWFLIIHDKFPKTMESLISDGDLFGSHACWMDINRWMLMIQKMSDGMSISEQIARWGSLVDTIRETTLAQRKEDLQSLDTFMKEASIMCPLSGDVREHWSSRGIAGYENLPHSDERPRWRRFQEFVQSASKKEFLDRLRDHIGHEVQPINISWVGKWVGAEGSAVAKKCHWYVTMPDGSYRRENFVNYLIRGDMKVRGHGGQKIPFPGDRQIPSQAKKQWRLRNVALHCVLDIPEVKICADMYHLLNIKRVPSRALKMLGKALLNEKRKQAPGDHEELTGNRFPHNKGRVACRKMLREFFATPEQAEKLNADKCFPHELAFAAKNASSTAQRDMARAQYTSLVASTRKKMDENRAQMVAELEKRITAGGESETFNECIQKAMASGNFLSCVDVSESMTWDGKEPERPIDIATAMGAFMSQMGNDTWRGLMMSFTDKPRIFNTNGKQVDDVIRDIYTHKGYSTNFWRMMVGDTRESHDGILNFMCANKVPEDEMPVIVVFTDGEWDSQDKTNTSSTWQTMHTRILTEYAKRGYRRAPIIVYWNLKPGRSGVQTKVNHPGTIFLQGQSPNLFKFVMYGESLPDTEMTVTVDGQATKVKTSSVTPYKVLRKALDQEYLSKVDEILGMSSEGILRGYDPEMVEKV